MNQGLSNGQARLIEEIIEKGLCVRCGACVGLCPYFDFFDGKVVVQDTCNADASRCLRVCPVADMDETVPVPENSGSHADPDLGPYHRIITARSENQDVKKAGQYGGTVTALLLHAFEKRQIKHAVLTDKGSDFSPAGVLARNKEDILSCAGSRFTGAASLAVFNRAVKEGVESVVVVGVPCQMRALSKMGPMEPGEEDVRRKIALRIGLFCTWAVDYRRFAGLLRKLSVDERPVKYDIPPPPAEEFLVWTPSGEHRIPLPDVRRVIQEGCSLCPDMTAEHADISVGMLEGAEEWNTVIIRSEAGNRLVDAAEREGVIETGLLPEENLEHLKTAARSKRQRADEAAASGS